MEDSRGVLKIAPARATLTRDILEGKGAMSPYCTISLNDIKHATSIDYFAGDELAAHVFLTKYALTDVEGNLFEETPDDMHLRLAREFSRIESLYPNPMSQEEIYQLFQNFGIGVNSSKTKTEYVAIVCVVSLSKRQRKSAFAWR